MTETAAEVYQKLQEMGIDYAHIEHEAVHTIADCAAVDLRLNALTAKNYFLATRNLQKFYLCLVRPNARFKTADISRQAVSSRLSFGPEDKLFELLRVHPGAVSPMGLIFDPDHRVTLLVDRGLAEAPRLAFHPCDNTQTLAMRTEDFLGRFLSMLGCEIHWVEIHDFVS